jgi:hypothetical protein
MNMTNMIQLPRTGSESTTLQSGPTAALVDFYRYFNQRDLVGLAANWLDGQEPSMDNPIGGIRRGWSEIRAGYEKLFNGPARVSVEFHDYTVQQGADWCLFVGRERGQCLVGGTRLALAIRTTRWFVLRGSAWRQLHHHGSIESGAQLADYQRLVLGAPL